MWLVKLNFILGTVTVPASISQNSHGQQPKLSTASQTFHSNLNFPNFRQHSKLFQLSTTIQISTAFSQLLKGTQTLHSYLNFPNFQQYPNLSTASQTFHSNPNFPNFQQQPKLSTVAWTFYLGIVTYSDKRFSKNSYPDSLLTYIALWAHKHTCQVRILSFKQAISRQQKSWRLVES